MPANNSFKQLMEEEEKQYPHAPPEIERDITGSMRVIKFMGNIVELYLPRIFDLFLSMMGGKSIKAEDFEDRGDSESDSDDSPDGDVAD